MATQFKHYLAKRVIILILLTKLSFSQVCNNFDTCNTACIGWEIANTFCNRDSSNWPNKVSCLCQYPYHQINSGSEASRLNQCVICNVGNVGPSGLAYYQFWTAVCDVYASEGEQSALSVANTPQTVVIEEYSTTLLPLLSSSFCGGAITTSTTTSNTVPTPTSTSTSTPTSRSTSTSPSPSTSTPTPTPTPNKATVVGIKLFRYSTTDSDALFLAMLPICVGVYRALF